MTLSKFKLYLLKSVIPLIRIVYFPGYGEFQNKGWTITIEADVKKTLNENILPRPHKLIPMALKRKFTFRENFIELII